MTVASVTDIVLVVVGGGDNRGGGSRSGGSHHSGGGDGGSGSGGGVAAVSYVSDNYSKRMWLYLRESSCHEYQSILYCFTLYYI